MKRLTLKMFDKRKFVLESQVKEEGNLYHLKEMWQRLSCCAKTLGLKKKKVENVKVKDIFPPSCPKLHISYKAPRTRVEQNYPERQNKKKEMTSKNVLFFS